MERVGTSWAQAHWISRFKFKLSIKKWEPMLVFNLQLNAQSRQMKQKCGEGENCWANLTARDKRKWSAAMKWRRVGKQKWADATTVVCMNNKSWSALEAWRNEGQTSLRGSLGRFKKNWMKIYLEKQLRESLTSYWVILWGNENGGCIIVSGRA